MTGQHNAPTEAGADAENWRGDAFSVETRVGPGTDNAPPADYRQAAAVWARTQIRAFAGAGPIPEYGTVDWLRLPEKDPRRYAAVVIAAEQSRTPREPAARAAHRQTSPARSRPLQATPGWPPIAIPGCPGAFLTLEDAA